jgi:hypothetical protein
MNHPWLVILRVSQWTNKAAKAFSIPGRAFVQRKLVAKCSRKEMFACKNCGTFSDKKKLFLTSKTLLNLLWNLSLHFICLEFYSQN